MSSKCILLNLRDDAANTLSSGSRRSKQMAYSLKCNRKKIILWVSHGADCLAAGYPMLICDESRWDRN